jgi:cell division protein FtsW
MLDTTARKPDYVLLATVGALVAVGLVMVYSASFVEAYALYETQFFYALRQFIGAVIGTMGLLVAMRLNYNVLRRYSVHMMGVALVLLVLVLVLPATLTTVNGSRSWIRLGEGAGLFSVQPAELAKLAMIVYFADWLSRRGQKIGNVTYGLIPFAVMLGLICGLLMLQPDLGTTLIFILIGGGIYFAAGANLLHILGALGLGAAAFWVLVSFSGFGGNMRIAAFLDPWKYYSTFGYQPIHSLYALGSGGVFGEGLGQARQKFQWLPQAHTDAIFAIMGEELGFIGTTLLLLAFGVIAYRGYRIASRAPNPFAALVAVGITTMLVFQALLNIAVVTSLVPFTGLTLPFISYGSTSLIISMVGAGILLNISRHTVDAPREEQSDVATFRRSPALAEVFNSARRNVAETAGRFFNPAVWRRNRRTRLSSPGRRRSTRSNKRW